MWKEFVEAGDNLMVVKIHGNGFLRMLYLIFLFIRLIYTQFFLLPKSAHCLILSFLRLYVQSIKWNWLGFVQVWVLFRVCPQHSGRFGYMNRVRDAFNFIFRHINFYLLRALVWLNIILLIVVRLHTALLSWFIKISLQFPPYADIGGFLNILLVFITTGIKII